MAGLGALSKFSDALPRQGKKMPVLFIGHGSPMNGIEDNEFSQYWKKLGQEIPTPAAVLCISAHWLTRGTHITAMDTPKTIHDFGGFPQELFAVQYPAPGSPAIAQETAQLIQSTDVGLDHDWGLDHGCWTVVRHMYPDADVPVLQLSIDYNRPPAYHYKLAGELNALRSKGVLIMGSGNMVHNLRRIDWQNMNTPNFGFDWAQEINEVFKDKIRHKLHNDLIDYRSLGTAAQLAIPTPDHYYPLLYTLGLQDNKDDVEIFNDKYVGGSLTMTSLRISA
ncbi:4,5-DOPA-extradiol-dioxygenase [Flavilitoribacter nigricans]|uniref:4,5-DOPA dioxygenase extradiol n=1 Tax=Flavilitoribacter nigricans (strain ATCC 23147 / DSM 23189 / NBRC 102662 / NCIMB 1420 / SS-2) TaxID=1122177 RepID=A0A2D0MWJ8_FLAN2|nr:4,5-DOPA dioxygenase extradiol [Flavilitoribacter nigricans DSM 23189 = NBRC 102662]